MTITNICPRIPPISQRFNPNMLKREGNFYTLNRTYLSRNEYERVGTRHAKAYAIINESWILNLREELNKTMFGKIRGWFGKEKREMKEKIAKLECKYDSYVKATKAELACFEEDLHIHRKLAGLPETKTLEHTKNYWGASDSFNPITEADMQAKRDEAAKNGFVYFHTKTNGDEVWKKKDLA